MVGTMMCRHIHATIWQCTLDGPSLGLSMTMYSHHAGSREHSYSVSYPVFGPQCSEAADTTDCLQ